MAIIGIDLGTTNSLACIYRDGKTELIPNELAEYKTSSAVSVLQDGNWCPPITSIYPRCGSCPGTSALPPMMVGSRS